MSTNLPAWMQVETEEWDTDEPTKTHGYQFYDGTIELFFDPGPHIYYRYDEEGSRVEIDGVTTILDVINKPHLKAWAAKVAIEFVKDQMLLPSGSFREFSTEEFLAMLHEAKGQHKVRLDIAGDIGHIAHDILEKSIQHAIDNTQGVVLELKGLPTEDTPHNRMAISCANAGWEWMKAHNVRWLATERKVYSLYYNVAGTTDGICIVDSCTDLECCRGRIFKDRKAISDWKSSNSLSDSYAYQAAIYQFAQIEEFDEYISDRWVLRLGKEDGKFEPWYLPSDYFEADLKAFEAALQLYRSLKEITKRRQQEGRELRHIINERKRLAREAREAEERAERARIRAEKKEATKQRKETAKALYKKLRADGMSPDDAKAIAYPKADKPAKAETANVVDDQVFTSESPDEEWSIQL